MAQVKTKSEPRTATVLAEDTKRFKKSVRQYAATHLKTKKGAMEFLVSVGTHTPKGNLKKPYK